MNKEQTVTKLEEIIYTYENKIERNKLSEFAEGRLSAFKFSLNLIKKVKYEGNNAYTVIVGDFANKTVCELIESYRALHFDLEYQKLENKRLKKISEPLLKEEPILIDMNTYDDIYFENQKLKCIIKEHENLIKELDDKIKKFLPRK